MVCEAQTYGLALVNMWFRVLSIKLRLNIGSTSAITTSLIALNISLKLGN